MSEAEQVQQESDDAASDENDTSIDDATAEPIEPPRAWLPHALTSDAELVATLDSDAQRDAFAALRAEAERLADELALAPVQRLWLDARLLRRYLRARAFDVGKASALLRESLRWRRERGVWSLRPERDETLRFEMASGKMYRAGRDRHGRPIGYIRDRRQNSKDYVGQIDCVINLLERMIDTMDENAGVEQWVLIFDFRGYSNANRPPLSMCREVLDVFMNQYPERLGHAFFCNAPWLFNMCWSALSPFIPSETKAKIDFVNGDLEAQRAKLTELVPPEQLETMFGGDWNNKYVHKRYFAAELEQVRLVQEHRELLATGKLPPAAKERRTKKKKGARRTKK